MALFIPSPKIIIIIIKASCALLRVKKLGLKSFSPLRTGGGAGRGGAPPPTPIIAPGAPRWPQATCAGPGSEGRIHSKESRQEMGERKPNRKITPRGDF